MSLSEAELPSFSLQSIRCINHRHIMDMSSNMKYSCCEGNVETLSATFERRLVEENKVSYKA